ncbi:hypothetical protein CHS0354_034583 [Potamilus streckersoni]|uniref:CAAX prenyl protease 2 n=1 Tax=Potamilus streckersoni TaxID=2493646 RepID=A0AAE0STG3_9BIVA|nr:hypothetical protein CHS0354_034583 [Potamilus streckersoni]
MATIVFQIAGWQSILLCLLFAVIYVASLYVWAGSQRETRDHPTTIKRRIMSVCFVTLFTPPLLWCFSTYREDSAEAHSLFEWLGIRVSGFFQALVLPLALTMILFLGPLTLHYMDGVFKLYLEPRYWTSSLKNYQWIRNHIVAPFSEEFIFRSCMLPLLVPIYGFGWSILICPLFFGVAHLHHMIEKVTHLKMDVDSALKQSLFQMGYTTVFGFYTAFIFLRTGHVIAPIMVHAFCNHMGFPAFNEVMAYQDKSLRQRLMFSFGLGLILWIFLLYPMTSPFLYSNDIYNS